MITGSAAGHDFVFGVCACGRKLVDIQHVTIADVNEHNIAHTGSLTGYEVEQIQALVARMRRQVDVSFGWHSAPEATAATQEYST